MLSWYKDTGVLSFVKKMLLGTGWSKKKFLMWSRGKV